eukprot:TRINITY_DN16386_c0_g1_i1.p2 TRINITY_DN16386_c0_g1~~TRINITY_DN16386_c0_g1_i1.p2  ORF type:complete len:100 (-),score=29.84 TRINITY_DN16386_c0_g1_i1:43-342(-)
MLFTIMYLQVRLPSLSSRSFTIMNQVLLLLYAWYCTLTRISDYKHHPTDVLSGSVLGALMAIATFWQTWRGEKSRESREGGVKIRKRGKERNVRETLMS